MAFMSGLLRLLKWLLIAAVIVFVLHWWVTNKEYLFTVEELTALAKKHAGKDIDISTKLIHRELQKKYPGHILPEEDLEWIYLNSGGWMASFCVLHATLTEYIMLLGTPIQSSGHSGRYWANLTDIVLTGNFTLWKEGTTKPTFYQPGEAAVHPMFAGAGVQFAANTWVIEYARGVIPSTLNTMLAGIFFTSQDVVVLYNSFRVYNKALALEASTYLLQLKDYFEQKA